MGVLRQEESVQGGESRGTPAPKRHPLPPQAGCRRRWLVRRWRSPSLQGTLMRVTNGLEPGGHGGLSLWLCGGGSCNLLKRALSRWLRILSY